MTSTLDGMTPVIYTVEPNSNDIIIMSDTGPAGPQGPAGPPGPAFEGDAVNLINPETGLAMQNGEFYPVKGTLEVDIPPITIPPIEIPPLEFPDEINVRVLSGTLTVENPVSTVAVSSLPAVTLTGPITIEPVEFAPGQVVDVNILSGGSTFDGQLTQDGEPVSALNPLQVEFTNQPQTSFEISNLPDVQEVSG